MVEHNSIILLDHLDFYDIFYMTTWLLVLYDWFRV